MEIMSDTGRGSVMAQDVQKFQRILAELERNQSATMDEVNFQADRSMRTRLSSEITGALSDAISIMKKTGDQIRSSGQ